MFHDNHLPKSLLAAFFLFMLGFAHPARSWSLDESTLSFNLTARLYPIGVSMMLTNPAGLRSGDNIPVGLKLREIPNSGVGYDGPGDDSTRTPQPQSMTIELGSPVVPGIYKLAVFSSTDTAFFLRVNSGDSDYELTTVDVQGTIAHGATQEFTIDYSPAPGTAPIIRPVLNTAPLNQNSVASCRNVSLSGHAVADGPLLANGAVDLVGDSLISGDVTAASVKTTGHSKVTGRIILSPGSMNCFPADLTAALQLLTASNDNANIPAGFLNAGILRVAGKELVTLTSGDYLVDRLEMSGGSRLVASGPVRIFVRQSVQLAGQAIAGTAASPLTIFSDTTGTLSSTGTAELHAILYAPTANINLSGQTRIIGKVHAAGVAMTGTAKVEAP